MKRTSAEGNSSGRYTEGNPATGVPATVVGAEEMNNLQEELVNIVLDAGIALDGSTEDQVLTAIKSIMKRGGDQVEVSLADNQSSAANVAGVSFDKDDTKAARLLFNIHRRDDAQHADETGEMHIWHDTETDTWELALTSHNDDAGVTFTITAAGQLQYKTTEFGDANYSGTLRITNILQLNQ